MDRTNRRPTREKLSSGHIQGLAKDVLNVARGNLNPETSRRIEFASDWLERYCLSNKFDASTAVNTLISRGVHADAIVDYCIPRIARIYGQEWSNDSLSFATVSVGCAHLQLVLKHIIHQRGFNAPCIEIYVRVCRRARDHVSNMSLHQDKSSCIVTHEAIFIHKENEKHNDTHIRERERECESDRER